MKTFITTVSVAVIVVLAGSCMPRPPKIAALPAAPKTFALRLHVFGAEAIDARSLFESVRRSNDQLEYVPYGGDGELLMGIDAIPGRCVEPTAYCEYRVGIRVKNGKGQVVYSQAHKISQTAASCSNLCRITLQKAASFAVEQAAISILKGANSDMSGSAASDEPAICKVGKGARLPSEDAEIRMAQVDALKRQGVLDESEFDCLRKALLDRL